MLFQTNFLFSFLVFFPFFSLFVLIFFLYSVLFFYVVKIPCFLIPSTGHGKGLFIVPVVTSVLLFCPLTTFVWSGHACLARQRRIHFCLFCAPRTHFVSACRGLSCLDVYFLSPHTQSTHSTVPSQIASFGWSIITAGRTPQKWLKQGPKIDPFPSPHHQTTPPLPPTSGPWLHHVLYWLGTGWWRLGLARASLLILSKRLPAAHVSAVT